MNEFVYIIMYLVISFIVVVSLYIALMIIQGKLKKKPDPLEP